jgi:broad specificity phosphatase PhoE
VGTLLLIRHGQASYGEANYDRLSIRGREQAAVLGPHLAAGPLDALYVGPHVRQQETLAGAAEAAAAAGPRLPAAVTIPELAEYPGEAIVRQLLPRLVAEDARFAAVTAAPSPRLLDEAFHALIGRWSRDEWRDPAVERVGEFAARVRAGLDRVLRAAGSGARVACVTSAGPIGVAVGLALELSEARMVRMSTVIRNASITELRFRGRDFDWRPDQLSLVTFNVTAHLPPALHTER